MKLVLQYFYKKRQVIGWSILCGLIYLLIFSLSGIDLKAAVYPALLCLVFGIVFLLVGFFRLIERHRRLEFLEKDKEPYGESLPKAADLCEADYQKLLKKEEQEWRDRQKVWDDTMSDMEDFNYRYSPHRAKIWELLRAGEIGDITSVDFHWYLDTSHGADYFRRWHRLVECSGSLWVHKASHHFDLLNWWIDSDPESVYALGSLDHYGKNGTFRAENCRTCPHTSKCKFYYDITRNQNYMDLYVANEKYDGYLRDGCVFKNDVNIFDKMAATIRYKNGVQVAYSLTTYSPYEGYRIAFNGTKGRLEAWIQESRPTSDVNFDELVLFKNFGKREYIQIPFGTSGHGGGDALLKDQIFLPGIKDPYKQCASVRDGALACLVGIAARNSIATGQPVKIADLTSIQPQEKKLYQRIL